MKTIKAKDIQTPLGRIIPSLKGDCTRSGEEITASSMFMTMQGGKATLKHKGKKIEIDFTSIVPSGATLLRAPNGRQFALDIEKLINHAMVYGLLDPELRFEKETK